MAAGAPPPALTGETAGTHSGGRYDVIVAGGGAAGLVAGLAAARAGARTLVLERQGCLGGVGTSAYVAQYIGFFNGSTQAVWGLPYEFARRILAAGGSEGFRTYVMGEALANPMTITNFPFNPEIVKIVADDMTSEAGIDTLFHVQAVEPVMADGDRVAGVYAETIAGRIRYDAPVVVDATGDATLAWRAGVAMQPDLGHTQPHSLVFRLSNVDVKRFRAIPREEKRALALEGLRRGELYWESLSFMSTPGGHDAICLMSRIRDLDVLDPAQAAEAERVGRRQVRSIVGFLNRDVPGFENAILAGIAARLGVRETRRIVGRHTLTVEDILDRPPPEDAIALGSGPLDIHDPDGTGVELSMPPVPWGIPMRCLIPAAVEGLLVTGRAISATQDANGGARHMATAMALGEAAGTMAAVAAGGANATAAIPAVKVQDMLRSGGAALTLDDTHRLRGATTDPIPVNA